MFEHRGVLCKAWPKSCMPHLSKGSRPRSTCWPAPTCVVTTLTATAGQGVSVKCGSANSFCSTTESVAERKSDLIKPPGKLAPVVPRQRPLYTRLQRRGHQGGRDQ